jgi:large subunit ribosomal protein L15
MRIEELRPAPGSRKKNKRVGRGSGSGHGKTATKGHKGQKARSGGGKGPGFEGGQMPLQRRLPKRGFKNLNHKEYAVINLDRLNSVEGDTVTPEMLLEERFIGSMKDGVKVLGTGELKRALTIKAHAFSDSAMKKIAEAGGKAEVIG